MLQLVVSHTAASLLAIVDLCYDYDSLELGYAEHSINVRLFHEDGPACQW